jgi:hypothetical protein
MEQKIDDGGPAFPCEVLDPIAKAVTPNLVTSMPRIPISGMSLRDYFAAHAPEPPESYNPPPFDGGPYPCLPPNASDADWCEHDRAKADFERRRLAHAEAAWAYCYADAMLAAREVPRV